MGVWTRVLLLLRTLAPFIRSSALMVGVCFDVLAAGFELERRRIRKGITARIPTAVLQGIASHEGIKVNSSYRPTTV